MKTIQIYLMVFCLIIGYSGAVMAQNEGKHLGSTQDVQRVGEPLYVSSVSQSSQVPRANDAGGKYSKEMYARETGMYLEDGWLPGYALLVDGTRMGHLLLRYDIYNQQMQFISKGDTLAFSDPGELSHIFMDGRKFIYGECVTDGVISKGYFEVLKEGECQLLLRRSVSHHMVKDGITGPQNEEFLRDVRYYVKKEDQVPREIRACKKSVLCAFADEEVKIKEFMKANDLKMKCCEDLMQVVAFYNSLH
jgi:hypothetical protein